MAEYWIDFASIILEASSSDKAFKKAIKIIRAGEVEIDQIIKNDR